MDDTRAIQAAIDAAKASANGRVVVPRGTYVVSDQPPLDGVALRIDAARGFTLRGSGSQDTHFILHGQRNAHMIAVGDCRRVEISELSLDGRREGREGTHGLRLAWSEGVLLRDLNISAVAHYGIGLQDGVLREITIEHVRIDDTGGDGIDVKNTENANQGLRIRDVHVSRAGQTAPKQAGLDIRGPASLQDVSVRGVAYGGTGVRFREDGTRTGLGGHDSHLRRFRIDADTESTGVAVAANSVVVSEGLIHGSNTGVIVLGSDARISGVAVSGARYAFRVGIGASASILDSCSGAASHAGLWLEGRDALVRDSVFFDNSRCGICVRPSAVNSRLVRNSFAGSSIAIDDEGVVTQIVER